MKQPNIEIRPAFVPASSSARANCTRGAAEESTPFAYVPFVPHPAGVLLWDFMLPLWLVLLAVSESAAGV
jgi:hypothetical protein